MDNIITFTIVAIAALWAVARLRRHFAAKRTLGCAGCSSGCDPATAQRSRLSRCGAARVTGLLIAAVVLASPRPLFAQEASKDVPSRIIGGISVGGFADMKATTHRADQAIVTIGDFEVNLPRHFGTNVDRGRAGCER